MQSPTEYCRGHPREAEWNEPTLCMSLTQIHAKMMKLLHHNVSLLTRLGNHQGIRSLYQSIAVVAGSRGHGSQTLDASNFLYPLQAF
jgi:hypothetical protein